MSTLHSFKVGQSVRIHPASDWFMRGETGGVVTVIGSKWVHVKLDRSRKLVKFNPRNLEAA